MLRGFIYLLLLCFVFFSCQNSDDVQTLGTWKLYGLTESGQKQNVDLKNFEFKFNADGSYHFHGSSQMVETGTYRTEGDKLYTTDTSRQNALEKVVRVVKLSKDSMNFEMNNSGIPMEFLMVRAQ